MPGWMQAFVKVNPITHIIGAVRDLANNGHIGGDFGWSVLGSVILIAVLAPLTVKMYMRKA